MQLLTIVQTVIFIIVMGLVFAENSIAQNTKISADLQSIHPADLVDVIVEFDPAAYRNSAADRQEKFRGMGATLKESLPSVRSEILSISRRDLTAIADDPGVVSVRPDRRIRSTISPMMDLASIRKRGRSARSSACVHDSGSHARNRGTR